MASVIQRHGPCSAVVRWVVLRAGAAVVLALVAGCGRIDFTSLDDADTPPLVTCASPKVWHADFSSDPTTRDDNGDSILDWDIRGGAAFNSFELSNGQWTTTGGDALDSQPKQNFATPVRITGVVHDTDPGTSTGALFWVNAGYGTGTFMPVFAAIHRDSNGTQTVSLNTCVSTPCPVGQDTYVVLARKAGFPDDFVRVVFEVDPVAGLAQLLSPFRSPVVKPNRLPVTNDDRWATATSLGNGTAAIFDDLLVEVCP